MSRLVRSIAIGESALSSAEAHVLADGRLGVPGRCAAGPPFNCRDKKVASMASTLVLFFTQVVLMFGL